MTIKLQLPKLTELRPRITVMGIGGAGGNAVNNMIAAGLTGVEFVAANTDAQALLGSSAEHRIQLGVNLTEGLGAGSKPEIGEAAAEEAIDEIRGHISGSHMLFIAAGMGGGTGSGAAAVVARAARELDVLVVAVVTKPFLFEGSRRMRIAEAGIVELRQHVDTMIVIPNQNLFRVASEKTTFADAFLLADQVLYSGIACIVDLIIKEGLINLDFADVRTVMKGMGSAMMGTGEAAGADRAVRAAEEAIANPLLEEVSMTGARGLLLSITGGRDLTLFEVDQAATRVRQEVDTEANVIVGATYDAGLGEKLRVSIVASGMTEGTMPARTAPPRAGNGPATAAAARQSDGFRQQLTDALQPPAAAAAQVPQPPLPTGYPAHAPGRQSAPPASREIWQGPGGVRVESAPNPSPSVRAGNSVRTPPPAGAPAFAPAPPAEVRPSHRRMPELADFPEIGQRVYRGREQTSEQMSPRPVPDGARKSGFFSRIASGWSATDDDPRQATAGTTDLVPQFRPRELSDPQQTNGTKKR